MTTLLTLGLYLFLFLILKTIKKMDSNEQAKLTELGGKVDTLTTGLNTLIASSAETKAQLQALLAAEAGTDQTAAIQAIIDKIDTDVASVNAATAPADSGAEPAASTEG